MGFSTALLVVSLAAALGALATTRFRVPVALSEVLAVAGAAGAIGVVGAFTTGAGTTHGVFGLAHLLWLLLVVAVPLVLCTWSVFEWRERGRSRVATALGAAGLIVAGLGIWGTHIEPNWLRVDFQVLQSSSVTGRVRVGVLADMQTPNVGGHERNAVNTLLQQSPDLILVPGDLYQGSPATIAANANDFVTLLTQLVEGAELVVVVSGDAGDSSVLEPMTIAAGATYLDNATINTTVAGVDLRIAGVEVHGRLPGRASTLAGLTNQSDRLTLLVSHRPDVVYELARTADVDLIVSGHTHGGQVALPLLGPLVTFSDVPRHVAAGGLAEIEDFPIYVSTGVGLERRGAPQVRFGVRPSIGIIDIVP